MSVCSKVAMPVCKWQFICVPVLMYPKYTPLRYSKITISPQPVAFGFKH